MTALPKTNPVVFISNKGIAFLFIMKRAFVCIVVVCAILWLTQIAFNQVEAINILCNLFGINHHLSPYFELWQSFMPVRQEVEDNIGSELYSIEVYAPHFFNPSNPDVEFEKWAAIEVTDFDAISNEMETITSQMVFTQFLSINVLQAQNPKHSNIFLEPVAKFTLLIR
jgi:hypothetical protein